MVDPISLAIGAIILAGGWVMGRLDRPHKVVAPTPHVCGCGHPFALHDLKTDECHASVTIQLWNTRNSKAGIQWEQCPCRHYAGERPIDITTLDLPGYRLPESEAGGDHG